MRSDLFKDRTARLAMVAARERELGLPTTKELNLAGAYPDGGGEIGIDPAFWLDRADKGAEERDRRIAKAKQSGRGNSATFALLQSFARGYQEPSLYVWRGPWMDMERSERLDDHPAVQARGILRRPNPMARLTMSQLMSAKAKAGLAAGNFYLVKARTGGGSVLSNTTGAVAALWPVWARRMAPAVYTSADGKASNGWIDYYAYQATRAKPVEIPVENVVHFRNGLRDDEPRLGIGVVEEFALEVGSDTDAMLLVSAVLANLGFPGMVISPEVPHAGPGGVVDQRGGSIPREDREALIAQLEAKTTGSRRARPIVFSRPTKFEQFKLDLAQYNLEHIWAHVETRMAGVIGWPAILAGLQAGLESATYANVRSLMRFSTENALVPTWEEDAETWTEGLADDLGLRANEWIGYDYRRVRALQEDQDNLWKRVGEHFLSNAITIGEHHQLLDLELPAGVDPDLRRSEIEASSQLSRLLAPALGKSMTFLVDGTAIRPAPMAIEGKAATPGATEKWRPDDTTFLSEEELDEGEPTEDDVRAAVEEMERRIATLDPSLSGILGATEQEEEVDSAKHARPFLSKGPGGNSWIWDEARQRYRWPNTGRLVPEGRVFTLRERLIADSGKRIRSIAQEHVDGRITLSQMQKQIRGEYTNMHLGLRAMGKGGEGRVTRDDRAAVSAMVLRENGYLAGFARDIADGRLSKAQVLARAEMYAGASYRQSFADARLVAHRGAGFGFKERLIKSSKPCTTCVDEAARGRVPIDEPGFVIGDTVCKANDHCEIVFYREE